MIDLHTHTLLSDGVLLPAELVRRYEVAGFRAVAITDHVDFSNIDTVISSALKAARKLNQAGKIEVIAGIEITHVPPKEIAPMAKYARKKGCKLILVHGETLVEPVAKGTNRAALLSDINILAHPGLISESEAELARRRGIYLELTTRRGHSLTNGHVARLSCRCGARLLLNTDFHRVEDIISPGLGTLVIKGAGLGDKEADEIFANSERLIKDIK